MAATTTTLAAYLRLPADNAEDLKPYLEAAVTYMTQAGVPEFTDNAMYDIAVMALAAMYYDNRGLTFSGSYQATAEENARKLLNSFILQLRSTPKEDSA